MAVGLMEAFYLFERHGRMALTDEEILFMASARRNRGCRMIPSKLTNEEIRDVIKIGIKIKKWKDGNR